MIRLTWIKDGQTDALYVPENVIVLAMDGETYVSFPGSPNEGFKVSESPEEVARKVLEYKLAMLRYSEYMTDYNEKELYKLAGLEEQKDE